jgi:hypothetical protein
MVVVPEVGVRAVRMAFAIVWSMPVVAMGQPSW